MVNTPPPSQGQTMDMTATVTLAAPLTDPDNSNDAATVPLQTATGADVHATVSLLIHSVKKHCCIMLYFFFEKRF